MTNPTDPNLIALARTEVALGDAIALLTAEIVDEGSRAEAARIVVLRDGEDVSAWLLRVTRTVELVATLGAAAFDMSARLYNLTAHDDATSAQALLQRYAAKLAGNENRRRAIAYRCYDPNQRPPGMANHYCPACGCNKSGRSPEPNPVTEACDDRSCVCHDDTIDMEGIR